MNYRQALEDSAKIERNILSQYEEFKKIILENVRGKCLEIGCGDGLTTEFLKRYTSSLISLDLSYRRIKIAKKVNPEIPFTLSDARNLPFKDEFFDSVCAFEVIEHLPSYFDHHKFLKEVRRVLKKGGVFIVSTPNRLVFRIYCRLLGEKHTTHFSELTYFQFRKILREYFTPVKLYGQFGWLSLFYKLPPVKLIHFLLSKLTFLCKGLLGVCVKLT